MEKTDGKRRKYEPSVYWRRLYRQFKVFYKSTYGKVGFYILLAFAVITLVTPFVVEHPNYTYIAPEVDTHVASEIVQTHLKNITKGASGVEIYSPMSTTLQNEGTSAIYLGTSNGDIYCYGLGATKDSKLGNYSVIYESHLKGKERMLQPIMFPLINCQMELAAYSGPGLFQRFVALPIANGSNGNVVVGTIAFETAGLSKPTFTKMFSFPYNGTLVGNITSNSKAFTGTVSTSIPACNFENYSLNPSGQIYLISKNATGDYLYRYEVSPNTLLGVDKLNMKNPVGLSFYGASFSATRFESNALILIWNNTSLNAYSPVNGNLVWSKQIGAAYNAHVGPIIPKFYQVSYAVNNSAYYLMGSSVESINLDTGFNHTVKDLGVSLVGLSTTTGHSGLPSDIIATSNLNAYVLTYNSTGVVKVKTVALPVNSGTFSKTATYDSVADSLILVSNKGSILSFNLNFGTSYPFSWSAGLSPIPSSTSNVQYFKDATTGVGAIAITASNNYIYLYSSTAKECTPIPPMAKLPSGSNLLLGSTQYGNDVWARFMESFGNDWIFGISIGFFTIIISLAVAMYVGYKGGFGGEAVETLSLALFLVPGLALLIALSSVINSANFITLILIVSLTGWPFAAFTLIGVVRGVSARSFVEASKLFGSKGGSIMRRHIMPNIGPLLLYLLALSIGGGIGAVSGLEFLGLAPLTTATWGGMLNAAYTDYFVVITQPQWILPPAIALTMFIFSLIFVSRGMDEVVNPRLRRR